MQQVLETLALASIRIDGGTQPRASVDMMYVAELAQAIQDGTTLPAIITFYDGTNHWLADGFHRYYASQQLDKDTIDADIRQGTRRDAQLYSFGANAQHGLRRTNDDKRRAVETMLKDPEWTQWSNVAIAQKCGVDEKLVRRCREELTSAMPKSDMRMGMDGRVYNTSSIGRSQLQEHKNVSIDAALSDFHNWEETTPEEKPETTEQERYMLAVDNGMTDYYYDDLRRDAFQRDQERREEVITTKSATLMALQSSDSNEWYTPQDYVEAARELMGGIDVDPASCELANQTVKASRFYTKEDDGLHQSWSGRCWLNPPYGVDSGVSNQEVWSRTLIERYKAGLVSEAVLLVNANTEAKWFQPLYGYLICLTNHRIRFYNADGVSSQPTQGNAIIYLGKQKRRFIEIFSRFGEVVRRANTNDY